MHRILVLPDIRPAGYPVNLKAGYPAGYPVRAGYRISGRIFFLTDMFLAKHKISFFLKCFNNYSLQQI
jgi:hypothetical protein